MKKLLFALLLISSSAFAQTDTRKAAEAVDSKVTTTGELKEGWTKGGTLAITANQMSQDNWVGASDKSSIAINGGLNYFAYKKWDNNLWKNDLIVNYGVIRSTSTYDKFRKNSDAIALSSLFAKKIKKNLYYAASLDINTQISKGFDYSKPTAYDTSSTGEITPSKYVKTSNIFNPGNIRLGLGILWQPRANFSIYFSPLTANISTKLDKDFKNIAFNNVDAGKTINFGLGALLRADYFAKINKSLTYKSRFVAFTDYLDRPFDKIDLDWTNSIIYNATKYLGVKFDLNFRYYEGQSFKLQRIQTLGVGFTYALK